MSDGGSRVAYVLDANVLIDYANSDPWVIRIVCNHLGHAGACEGVLLEAHDFTDGHVETTGLMIIQLTAEQLVEAYALPGALSPQDTMCLIAARDCHATCVTNEKPLRNACKRVGVKTIWGLELMLLLADKRLLTSHDALRTAREIQASNPRHITDEILQRFTQRLRQA